MRANESKKSRSLCKRDALATAPSAQIHGKLRKASGVDNGEALIASNFAPSSPSGQRFTFDQIRAREDANGDGRVPREEFEGPPPLFDRLDRNHDGVLTKEDLDDA